MPDSNDQEEANGQQGAPCSPLLHRHILVPLDGSELSEAALPYAVTVAQATEAHIALLRVIEPGEAPRGTDPVDWELARSEARTELERCQRKVEELVGPCEVAVVQGKAAEQILGYARDRDVDLIVLSSHGHGGLSGWYLGSTAHKVLARATCSVLLVPAFHQPAWEGDAARPRRVLMPLDCSLRAECAFTLASRLARSLDAEILLAHLVPPPELPRRLVPDGRDSELAEQITERNLAAGRAYLETASERLARDDVRVRCVLEVSSRVTHGLQDIAQREQVDLIVMTSHGRTGDPGDLHGHVTSGLLQSIHVPVLVLQVVPEETRPSTAPERAIAAHPGH